MKNPFIAGNWVRGENFFGRTELIHEILEGENHYMWVTGTRRLGKTSLLKQIEYLTGQEPLAKRFISLFWNMQGATNLTGLEESLIESVEDAEKQFRKIGVSVEDLEEKNLFDIIRVLRRQAKQQHLVLVLLCDECEELINVQKHNPEALPRLRRTLQQGDNLRTVISATKRLMRLEESVLPETSPFIHGLIPPFYLPRLDDEGAAKLIRRGDFDDSTVDEIMKMTNNHPYLMQILCRRLFEGAVFNDVIQEMCNDEMVSHFFAVDFEYLENHEKLILWYVLNEERLSPVALQKKTALRSENLSKILHGLLQLGYLQKTDATLQISNYFFHQWLGREKERLFSDIPAAVLSSSPAVRQASYGPSLIGRDLSHYTIIEKIGEGGMGVVFKARDQRLERTVALKMLPPEVLDDPQIRERFWMEARTASVLNHTNIATIYEIDEAEGIPFIVMEYVDGITLRDWCPRYPNELNLQIDIALQIAQGIRCAHHHGIIHRDIKPENIMINQEGVVKITDFGLAKTIHQKRSKLTKTGSTLGTLAYMSPEQAAGQSLDHRSDLFSLGLLFFELFTGELPFKAEYEAAYLYALIHEPPRSPREINPKISRKLEQVLYKLVEKDKDSRFQNIETVIEALKQEKQNTTAG